MKQQDPKVDPETTSWEGGGLVRTLCYRLWAAKDASGFQKTDKFQHLAPQFIKNHTALVLNVQILVSLNNDQLRI